MKYKNKNNNYKKKQKILINNKKYKLNKYN